MRVAALVVVLLNGLAGCMTTGHPADTGAPSPTSLSGSPRSSPTPGVTNTASTQLTSLPASPSGTLAVSTPEIADATVLPLPPGGRGQFITGKVIDEGSQPIVGALVDAQPRAFEQAPASTSSDGTFDFSAYGLEPGRVTLTVDAEGFLPFTGVVTLRAGQVVHVTIVLQRR